MMNKKKEKNMFQEKKRKKNPKHNLREESISQWVRSNDKFTMMDCHGFTKIKTKPTCEVS